MIHRPTYLEQLTLRLASGLADVDEPLRSVHADYLLAAQQADGGFAGREGAGDLYYTGLALRALAVLGHLEGEPAQKAAQFLRGRLWGKEAVVDFLSLIYGAALLNAAAGIDIFADVSHDWRQRIADALEKLRRDDGGYAKGSQSPLGSTYHTFLVLLTLELIEQPVSEAERIVQFLLSQRAEEGGFREIRLSKRAGTNPTAAAIGALRILAGREDTALDEQVISETVRFLVEMQTDEGGLRANTRIPIADLLSTFTGSLTLADLESLERIDVPAARQYAQSLQIPEGGFHGAAWDTGSDVEYTFYGLGCLALLSERAVR